MFLKPKVNNSTVFHDNKLSVNDSVMVHKYQGRTNMGPAAGQLENTAQKARVRPQIKLALLPITVVRIPYNLLQYFMKASHVAGIKIVIYTCPPLTAPRSLRCGSIVLAHRRGITRDI